MNIHTDFLEGYFKLDALPRRYTMLGVNSNRETCCILGSVCDFDDLMKYKPYLRAKHFEHDCTDWGGQDSIERTCKLRYLIRTGRKIVLDSPIVYSGVDGDMGHDYEWEFVIDEIHEVRSKWD